MSELDQEPREEQPVEQKETQAPKPTTDVEVLNDRVNELFKQVRRLMTLRSDFPELVPLNEAFKDQGV